MSTKTDQELGLEPPREVERKSFLIAGLRARPKSGAEIPELWQRLMTQKIPRQVGQVGYGLNFNTRSVKDDFEYMAGVEVSDSAGLPPGLASVRIPAQRYAVFSHRGDVSAIHQTCEKIAKWLPNSGYRSVESAADAPDFFERYGEEFNPQTGTGGIEIWVPIK